MPTCTAETANEAITGETLSKTTKGVSHTKKAKGKRAARAPKGITKKVFAKKAKKIAVSVSSDGDDALPAANAIPEQRPVRSPRRPTSPTAFDNFEDERSNRNSIGPGYLNPTSIGLVNWSPIDESQLGTVDAEYSDDEEYWLEYWQSQAKKSVPPHAAEVQLRRRSPRKHEGSLEPVAKAKPEGQSKRDSCNDKHENGKREADEEHPSTPPHLDVGASIVPSAPAETASNLSSSSEVKLKRKRSDESFEDAPAVKVRRTANGSSILPPAISESALASAIVPSTPDVTPLVPPSITPPSPGRARSLARQAPISSSRKESSNAPFP